MNERVKFLEINDDQKERIEELRLCFSSLYDVLDRVCQKNRETSLAYTKLEEAQFWAIKGISREDSE